MQVRLVTNLGESRRETAQPTMLTLIECLNKVISNNVATPFYFVTIHASYHYHVIQVRESQNLIVSSQNQGFASQTATNKLLVDVVTSLETTHSLLDRFTGAGNKITITAKLSDICDDLGTAVTGLVSAQDQLANCSTNNMAQLDKLIKSASTIMREDTWNSKKRLSVAADEGPAAKRRTGGGGVRMVVNVRDAADLQDDSCGAASPASEVAEDWEVQEVRQPTVKVRQAILSPRQKAELRRSLETPDQEDSGQLRDEFASPEKN